MMLPQILLIILGIECMTLLGFLVHSLIHKKTPTKPLTIQTPPYAKPEVHPQSFRWSTQEVEKVINSAQKKAEAIITQAELDGIKIAAESKIEAEDFKEQYSHTLEQSVNNINAHLTEYLTKAENSYQEFLKQLEQKGAGSQQEVEELIKSQVSQILFNLEQNLTTFLSTSQERSIEAINLELKSARSLIDSYRTQQLQLIDENIVAVLERTLSLVLRNTLNLHDHLDLIYEGLEKAKIEKFFA